MMEEIICNNSNVVYFEADIHEFGFNLELHNSQFVFKCQILRFILDEKIMFRYYMDNTRQVEGVQTNNTLSLLTNKTETKNIT